MDYKFSNSLPDNFWSIDRAKLQYLWYAPKRLENVYIPHFHLYPMHPQILHQLVLELYVRVSLKEEDFVGDENATAFAVGTWPIYKVWWMLWWQWKFIQNSLDSSFSHIVLIATEKLSPDIDGIISEYDWMHALFWVIPVQKDNYASWFLQSSKMFSIYAKTIEAQLPFIRAYIDLPVVPYIINDQRDQEKYDDIIDTIIAHHGDEACVVFIEK